MFHVADVVVVGAGSTGTAAAWQLGEQGAGRVLLLERSSLASGTTGRSCAVLRMHYTHELLAKMALRSLRVFKRFDEVIGGPVSFRPVGFMFLVPPEDVEPLGANVKMQRHVGVDSRLLCPEEALEIVPEMRVEDVGAVAWEPDSGYADPHLSTAGFLAAAQQHSVEYRPGVRVKALIPDARRGWRIDTSEGTVAAGAVVVAAGFRTLDLVRPLGIDLPVEPVRHTIAIVERSADFGPEHPIVWDNVVGSYHRPEASNQTLIGSTAADEGFTDPDVELDRSAQWDTLAMLAGRFAHRFPKESDPVVRSSYTSIYDCTPDLQPLLGPVGDHEGLHVAVGFSGHGFKIAPALGELLAEKVLRGRTTLFDIDVFRPSRFEEGDVFQAPHGYSIPTLG